MSTIDSGPSSVPSEAARTTSPPAHRRVLALQEREATTVRVSVPDEDVAMRPESTPPSASMYADELGRYQDLGMIARGGMASVRRVLDRWILRDVALKRRGALRSARDLARFTEEVQITGQLDHPNIVPVHDVELDDRGFPLQFTMKLVEGNTLKQLMTELPIDTLHGAALEEFLKVFLKACDAISFAHSRGVIHRDLKPDNVMVGSYGQVYVMDWGIAMLREGQRPSAHFQGSTDVRLMTGSSNVDPEGTLSGTPAYMAPEQAQGRNEDLDERTDVFGLGGILYHFLTSQAPFAGQSSSDELILAMNGQVIAPEARAPERKLPPGLCRIVTRALAPRPEDRYPSVDELAADVEDFLRGGGWFESRTFEAGTVIVHQGHHADCAYIVVSGVAAVTVDDGGVSRHVCDVGPGEVLGETGILADTTRTASVMARTRVLALRITRATLERELDRHQWLRTVVDAIATRFVQQNEELAALHAELDTLRAAIAGRREDGQV